LVAPLLAALALDAGHLVGASPPAQAGAAETGQPRVSVAMTTGTVDVRAPRGGGGGEIALAIDGQKGVLGDVLAHARNPSKWVKTLAVFSFAACDAMLVHKLHRFVGWRMESTGTSAEEQPFGPLVERTGHVIVFVGSLASSAVAILLVLAKRRRQARNALARGRSAVRSSAKVTPLRRELSPESSPLRRMAAANHKQGEGVSDGDSSTEGGTAMEESSTQSSDSGGSKGASPTSDVAALPAAQVSTSRTAMASQAATRSRPLIPAMPRFEAPIVNILAQLVGLAMKCPRRRVSKATATTAASMPRAATPLAVAKPLSTQLLRASGAKDVDSSRTSTPHAATPPTMAKVPPRKAATPPRSSGAAKLWATKGSVTFAPMQEDEGQLWATKERCGSPPPASAPRRPSTGGFTSPVRSHMREGFERERVRSRARTSAEA